MATVLPVLWRAGRGEVPGALGWIGMFVGVGALLLTSWAPRRADGFTEVRDGVALGALGGVAFAVMFLIAVSTSAESGTGPS